MNEKRQDFYKYKEGKTESELTFENMIALISSLESKARLLGALVVARQIEQLKKSALKNNSNKKIMKSLQSKYDLYKKQIMDIEKDRKTK